MKVSCLCPTYNRATAKINLLQEAVECFRRQTYKDAELIIGNDTPNQTLRCDIEGVRVINWAKRFPTLTDKLNAMIEKANGDVLCRWDDDDINLPHRLEYSVKRLAMHSDKLEWRATNYWYAPVSGGYHYTNKPGNTHCMALWHRDILNHMEWKGLYPPKMSGWEDQEFNRAADATGFTSPQEVPPEDIFYIYRWGSSPVHLSGHGGGDKKMQEFYNQIGTRKVRHGVFDIEPFWAHDYTTLAKNAAVSAAKVGQPLHPWA